jgi:hypothetical protein
MNSTAELQWYLRHEWQRRLQRPEWSDERSTEVRPTRRSRRGRG